METVDLRGTRCPLTLLKIKQYLYKTESLSIRFVFDDPGASLDLPLYLNKEKLWHLVIYDHTSHFEAVCTRESADFN